MTKAKKQKPAEVKKSTLSINWWLIALVVVATFLVYQSALNNKFTNWDDDEYITNNKDLADDSFEKHFIEKPHVMGNYHPLTMISLAWNYQNAYDESTHLINPYPFHRTNLVLHVLTAILIYFLFYKLTTSNFIAVFVSAAFAIHPMHVESVIWASERKDVLYAFFYFSALLTWFYFQKNRHKIVFYCLTIVLFLLSCFSKAVAVTLPLVLLAMDYYFGRKLNFKIIIEKIPFLIFSIYFGLRAVEAQKEFESLDANLMYSFGERMLFAGYGTMEYIFMFFIPLNLSCFYSYPPQHIDWGIAYYLAPLFVAGVLVFLWFLRRSKGVVFGFAFFFFTVFLVLQLMSVGGAVMADRYSYLPHVGIALVCATLLEQYITKKKSRAFFVYMGCGLFLMIMAVLANNRSMVWKDSITLWADAESKEKMSPKLYCNYGDALTIEGKYDEAVVMLNRSLELKNDYSEAFYNRGLANYYLKKYGEAIADYSMAIKHNPKLKQAWHNRAGTYFTIGKFKEALSDAIRAKDLGYPVDPMFFKALNQALGQ